MNLLIDDLGTQSELIRGQAAALLVEGFDEPRGWPTRDLAREEVALVLREGFARAAVEGATLLGWIGGLPEYAGRVWELHPMVVHREYRRRGVGRALVEAFEAEARRRGALTATLGTDDGHRGHARREWPRTPRHLHVQASAPKPLGQ